MAVSRDPFFFSKMSAGCRRFSTSQGVEKRGKAQGDAVAICKAPLFTRLRE